jgi:hypothetical protein
VVIVGFNQETAFRACRNLPRLSIALEQSIKRYVLDMPVAQFLNRYQAMRFSLSLSDAFKGVLKIVRLRKIDFILLLIGALLSTFILPYISLIIAVSALLIISLELIIEEFFGQHSEITALNRISRFSIAFLFGAIGFSLIFSLKCLSNLINLPSNGKRMIF